MNRISIRVFTIVLILVGVSDFIPSRSRPAVPPVYTSSVDMLAVDVE